MKNKVLILTIVFSTIIFGQAEISKISSMPGAFSRMGFGARGMGMGNAMSAITNGNLSAYYNPALSAFQEGNSFQTSYSILGLDRTLNFLNFTKKFEFGSRQGSDFRRSAGLSVGIINSGVTGIEEYSSSGVKQGDISVSENQFFLGLANRFSERLAIGVTFKMYYYDLYEDLTSTGIGFDIGALYKVNENFYVSAMLSDINSKYKWDTSDLWGEDGRNSIEKFPLLKKMGVSYWSNDKKIRAAVEIESSNAETNFLRVGAEYNIFQSLFIRAGVDKLNISNFDFPARPSAGFSYIFERGALNLAVDYAFVIDPYAPQDQHIIGVNFIF